MTAACRKLGLLLEQKVPLIVATILRNLIFSVYKGKIKQYIIDMNNTKHATDCKMTFGRKDKDCPRCQELIKGAVPRAWASARKVQDDARHLAEVRAHCCGVSCGPVCTFGDY